MKTVRILVLMLSGLVLFGCSAAGVPYTSDPNKKLDYAYALTHQHRGLPAEKLGKEALLSFEKKNDKYGAAEANVFLGQYYKSDLYRANASFYKRYNEYDETNGKSISYLGRAVSEFLEINNYMQASKSTFALANAYGKSDKDKVCELYDRSLELFAKGKIHNPRETFSFSSHFKSFEDMVFVFKGKYCPVK